ncbi:MAG: ABC transporter, permease protein (cluster 10, nitrate/sulfonate/bicarbonate) [Pseudolabrys sp.]|jgi:NitT/TauT family transport system permease protein|nr:ABC transporter, permease protein (cluster 10, nitrate/sulfonate/bicarbonate) [Pseudolabrys sp.]
MTLATHDNTTQATFVTVAEPKRTRRSFADGVFADEHVMMVLSPVALLLIWEIAGRLGLIDLRFFPMPSQIFTELVGVMSSGELWLNTTASLQRLAIGFVLGGAPALALGILMGLVRPLRLFVDPLVAATYPVPKSAILPLILLVFGLGEASKVVMVAIGVFYPVIINTTAGVLAINRTYLDVGKHFRATPWQTFRTIALPGAMPFIMTGFKLGAGLGLILIAIAEMIGAKRGLGYMIWNAWEILQVEMMYIGILVIAVIGFIVTILLNQLERWMVPWQSGR